MLPLSRFHNVLDRKNARAVSIEDVPEAFRFPPFLFPANESSWTEFLLVAILLPLEAILLVLFNKPNSLTGCLVLSSADVGNFMGDDSVGGERKGGGRYSEDMGVE